MFLNNGQGTSASSDAADGVIVPNREIRWLSSSEAHNVAHLQQFQKTMFKFWSSGMTYYDHIQYTASAWKSDPTYVEILRRLQALGSILEVGCGRANILGACPALADRYTGVDFNVQLMGENATRCPRATFIPLTEAEILPFPSGSFDNVFCTYVLEHCVFPQAFLRECIRMLRPGGELLLVCPNFLGRGCMDSQRAGFTLGTGREKLRQCRWWDALVTGFDRKVRIPLAAARARRAARSGGGFWINIAPTCFADPFYPDADAVYLTFDWEIVAELERGGTQVESLGDDPLRIFLSAHRPGSRKP